MGVATLERRPRRLDIGDAGPDRCGIASSDQNLPRYRRLGVVQEPPPFARSSACRTVPCGRTLLFQSQYFTITLWIGDGAGPWRPKPAAAHDDAGVGARGDSLPGATTGRQAEPVLPLPPGVPSAARWAAAMRARGESVTRRQSSLRGHRVPAAGPSRSCRSSPASRPRRGGRPCGRGPGAYVRSSTPNSIWSSSTRAGDRDSFRLR